MDYKRIFAFKKTKEDQTNNFLITDYDYLIDKYENQELKFEDDFYLRIFLKILLFEISIHEVEEFLDIQLINSNQPKLFFDLLELTIIPSIDTIIQNAALNLNGIDYYKPEKLEGNFISTESVIKNRDFDYRLFHHQTVVFKYETKFRKIIEILNNYINIEESKDDKGEKHNDICFSWVGGASQLAVVILELIGAGYINSETYRGELNKKKLAESLSKVFGIKDTYKVKSLEIYLNENGKKYNGAFKKFDDLKFKIPPKRFTE